ncbi:ttc15-prov protein, putative [Brugia malayi]|uniref:BMA-TRPP-12 n=1 Tax=Brugia malayi TaxID=6279 RepID=A0A0H5SLG3_BRUMA|nr:ttc15-prov protein, putative [Brugia malayi]CRZ24592.1 BMA-TRPP-12 [Brugia malayi]VIO85842.1 ttc15-prov protein, putative [Brugia malayi]
MEKVSDGSMQEWPDSDRLKEALSLAKFDNCYTMPGLKTNVTLPDLMASTLEQKLNKTVTRPSVSKDLDGVHLLIADGHLRAAVNLTAELLTEVNQGFGMAGQPSNNTEYSFKVWACRLQLLMALKLYTLLNDELIPFEELDAPDLFYQYYPNLYPESPKGSLVLFSMRLVHAEALRFTSNPWATLERIDKLEKNVNRVLDNSGNKSEYFFKIWKDRLLAVQKMRARSLFFLKEYSTSMILYNRLSKAGGLNSEQRIALKLMLMRMAMSIGDQKNLEHYSNEIVSSGCDDQILHRCLKYMFYGNYNEAYDTLQKCMNSLASPELCNNMAICLLYKGQIFDAMEMLKNLPGDPNEPVAINFSTIAELSISNLVREDLAIFAQKFDRFPDMFDPVTLKLIAS